jgi:hypothetical protein
MLTTTRYTIRARIAIGVPAHVASRNASHTRSEAWSGVWTGCGGQPCFDTHVDVIGTKEARSVPRGVLQDSGVMTEPIRLYSTNRDVPLAKPDEALLRGRPDSSDAPRRMKHYPPSTRGSGVFCWSASRGRSRRSVPACRATRLDWLTGTHGAASFAWLETRAARLQPVGQCSRLQAVGSLPPVPVT